MGADLVARPECELLYRKADEVLGFALTKLCFHGPEEELTETRYCQPALYVHGLACLAAFRTQVPLVPAFAAGLSLGEFTAHAAAGTMTFDDGLRVVATRGAAMQEACDLEPGGMTSLIGATPEQAREIAAIADVDVANLNCPGQVVLSGLLGRLERVPELAKHRNIKRALPLKVAGAYHSRLMEPAKSRLAQVLNTTPLATPVCPVVANFTAEPAHGAEAIKAAMLSQVTGSVRWEESMHWLRKQGVTHAIEFGPGEVIAGLMKRIDPALPIASIADAASLEKTVAWAKEQGLA
jgi:[acyl-carrier-protein] S-malonyltransferase